MPRRLRQASGGIVYHVLNRGVGQMRLFEKEADFRAFEKVLEETYERTAIRILGYCIMPNHWHLLLWPRKDGELSEVMRWLTVTHTQRWHSHYQTAGTGPTYQGRFKSLPVQSDEHFLTVARYVEQARCQSAWFGIDTTLTRKSSQAVQAGLNDTPQLNYYRLLAGSS